MRAIARRPPRIRAHVVAARGLAIQPVDLLQVLLAAALLLHAVAARGEVQGSAAAGASECMTTTAAGPATTPPTLPRRCAAGPVAATFRSLACRLIALTEQTLDEAIPANLRKSLLRHLARANARLAVVATSCADDGTITPVLALELLRRRVGRYALQLRTLRARRRVAEDLRTYLLQLAAGIRRDASVLQTMPVLRWTVLPPHFRRGCSPKLCGPAVQCGTAPLER